MFPIRMVVPDPVNVTLPKRPLISSVPLPMTPDSVSVVPALSNALPAEKLLLILKLLLNVRSPNPPARNWPSWSVTVPVPTELLTPGALLDTSTVVPITIVPPAALVIAA